MSSAAIVKYYVRAKGSLPFSDFKSRDSSCNFIRRAFTKDIHIIWSTRGICHTRLKHGVLQFRIYMPYFRVLLHFHHYFYFCLPVHTSQKSVSILCSLCTISPQYPVLGISSSIFFFFCSFVYLGVPPKSAHTFFLVRIVLFWAHKSPCS